MVSFLCQPSLERCYTERQREVQWLKNQDENDEKQGTEGKQDQDSPHATKSILQAGATHQCSGYHPHTPSGDPETLSGVCGVRTVFIKILRQWLLLSVPTPSLMVQKKLGPKLLPPKNTPILCFTLGAQEGEEVSITSNCP